MTSVLKKKYVKTIALTSGKGGVGKTNITASLAVALQNQGKRVMILDSDFGLSNIDVLFGIEPKSSILHLLTNGGSLSDIVAEGPHGIRILTAGSGVRELSSLDSLQRLKIIDAFQSYEYDIDVLLIDTAAGISENVAFFCTSAQEIIIITTPEPTSIADAVVLLKVLSMDYQETHFHVLVNFANSNDEALQVFGEICRASEAFKSISLDYLGCLPYDDCVHAAVRARQAFFDFCPQKKLSRQLSGIANKLLNQPDRVKGTLQIFMGNLLASATAYPR